MNPNRPFYFILCLIQCASALKAIDITTSIEMAEAKHLDSFEITQGTLEITSDLKRLYIFRSEGKEEAYDCTMEGQLKSDLLKNMGSIDLEEIGFCSSSGAEFTYERQNKTSSLEKFKKDHPTEKIEFYVFKGVTGKKLEIKVSEETSVYRVQLVISGKNITLWSNNQKK